METGTLSVCFSPRYANGSVAVDNEYRQCKAVAKEASLAFRRIWESASEVDCDAAKGETPDDLEEIDRQLIALKAKSQLNYNTDPMIVREYESKMAKVCPQIALES